MYLYYLKMNLLFFHLFFRATWGLKCIWKELKKYSEVFWSTEINIRRIWCHGFIISMKIQNQQQFSWLVWTRGNINTVTHLRLPILNYLAQFKFKTKVRSWNHLCHFVHGFLGISETDLLYITLIKPHQILKFCITIQLKKVNRFEHDPYT